VALNPPFRNGSINPALKITISDFEELMASQYPAHGGFVFREYQEDLPGGVVISDHESLAWLRPCHPP